MQLPHLKQEDQDTGDNSNRCSAPPEREPRNEIKKKDRHSDDREDAIPRRESMRYKFRQQHGGKRQRGERAYGYPLPGTPGRFPPGGPFINLPLSDHSQTKSDR